MTRIREEGVSGSAQADAALTYVVAAQI